MLQCVLHYMVGSRESAAAIGNDVKDILIHSGYMKQ